MRNALNSYGYIYCEVIDCSFQYYLHCSDEKAVLYVVG